MTDEIKSFDEVLEKNFSPETTDEEKKIFLETLRELKFTLGWNVVECDSLFNKERGPAICQELISQFNNWKSSILVDYIGLKNFVIQRIANICVFYWIRDSEIVSEVLNQVYNCDGHFSYMIAYSVNQNERRSMWLSASQETRQKLYLTIMYFLTHAHRSKLEFSGVRFVDSRLIEHLRVPPVFLAAFHNKPQLLLLLLRHGTIVDRRLVGGLADHWDLHMLLRHLIRTLWASLGTETDGSSWELKVINSTVNDECRCLRYILRGIRQIPLGELKFMQMNFELGRSPISTDSHDFIRSISERGFVPKLMSRYLEPSELRHLCRLTIREALNSNWNLPFGVFTLPLPKILQRYVNLSED